VATLGLLAGHWFVYSLRSEAAWTFAVDGATLAGRGFAHQEKNWGASFPRSYVWAHGMTGDGQRKFALAGRHGDGILGLETWLLGVRTPERSWDFPFGVAGGVFRSEIDGCAGKLTLVARDPLRSLWVEISAPRETFSLMSMPTEDGFAKVTEQSFAGRARISAYRHGPLGGLFSDGELVERFEIGGAALEFGGDYRCAAL
jgi:hypothetical protein